MKNIKLIFQYMKTIQKGTLIAIIQQAGLTRKEFPELFE
jgi:hypothetical protein